MNVFNCTGNLGGDPRTNNVNGTLVVNFSLAVKSGYGDRATTEWVDVAYWGKAGEAVAQYLSKGKQVAVSGELSLKPAEGTYPAKLSVRASSVTLLGSKNDSPASTQQAPSAQQGQSWPQQSTPTVPADDEPPF